MMKRFRHGVGVRHLIRALACVTLVNLVVALAGCSRGPNVAKVTGKVTFDGQPVVTGTITFYPESGRPAIAEIGPDGSFTLTTNKEGDGALVGIHKVTIHATKVGPGSIQDMKSFEDEQNLARSGGKMLVAGKIDWLVPEKYSREETSPLTATVKEGSNTINFELNSEP